MALYKLRSSNKVEVGDIVFNSTYPERELTTLEAHKCKWYIDNEILVKVEDNIATITVNVKEEKPIEKIEITATVKEEVKTVTPKKRK